MNSDWSSPPAVAKKYGIKVDKVHAWIASGELEAVNVAERPNGRPRWRISPEALQAFERRRSSRPAPASTKRRKLPKVPRYV